MATTGGDNLQEKRLAAVMVTDIAGFSTIMFGDREKAMALLARSHELIRAEVERCGGQWCEASNDRSVSLFVSAGDAVDCASALHQRIANESDLQLRIGIDMGEVLLSEGHVYGPPVDIASQAERFLASDGIALTQSVYDLVGAVGNQSMVELGQKSLKGIAQPVRLYAIERGNSRNSITALFAAIVRRRVLPILGAYLAASWGVVEVVDWLVDNGLVDEPWVYATLAALLAFIPSVALMAYNHGAPGRDHSTTQEKISVAINAAAGAALAVFIFNNVQPMQDYKPLHTASVAILPFDNLSNTTIGDSIGLGVAEEVINALVRTSGIYVAPRTSSFMFMGQKTHPSEIARNLRVATVLEGSVRVHGDRIRITAQLIDGQTNYHLWSNTYSRDLNDIFAVEENIAVAVATELLGVMNVDAAKFARESDGVSIEAYKLYLEGLLALREPATDDSLKRAEHKFRMALAATERYAQAHAGLCETYLRRHLIDRAPNLIDRAEDDCRAALKLDPTLRETRLALGELMRRKGDLAGAEGVFRRELNTQSNSTAWIGMGRTLEDKGEYAQAETAYRDAVSLEPGNWQARLALADFLYQRGRFMDTIAASEAVTNLSPDHPRAYRLISASQFYLGRFDASLVSIKKAIQLSPTRGAYRDLGLTYYHMEQYEEAVAAYLEAVRLGPDDHYSWGNLGITYSVMAGEQDAAERALQRAVLLAEKALARNPKDWSALANQAWYLVLLGRTAEGTEKIDRAIEQAPYAHGVNYIRALIHQQAGEVNEALECLEESLASGWPSVLAATDPHFHALRDDQRFRSLVNR